LFNNLDLLGYCDRKDMTKDHGLQEIDFESLSGKIKMFGENWLSIT
jgi:hypothetical protein